MTIDESLTISPHLFNVSLVRLIGNPARIGIFIGLHFIADHLANLLVLALMAEELGRDGAER
jgi:hypothetical protein